MMSNAISMVYFILLSIFTSHKCSQNTTISLLFYHHILLLVPIIINSHNPYNQYFLNKSKAIKNSKLHIICLSFSELLTLI